MRSTALATIALLLVPGAFAVVPDPCASAPGGTCAGLAPVVPATEIGAGQTATFAAQPYLVTGLIRVASGGVMLVRGSTFDFEGDAAGILVEAGGILDIDDALFQSTGGSLDAFAPFEIVAADGADLRFVGSEVIGGTVHVLTDDVAIQRVTFSETPLALTLTEVDATLGDLTFTNVVDSLRITGGTVTVERSEFQAGDPGAAGGACIDAVDVALTLTDVHIFDCATGVRATDGDLEAGQMSLDDRQDPGHIGFDIVGGAAHIHHAYIEDWGIGIRASNGAVLDQHDNTFANNHVDF